MSFSVALDVGPIVSNMLLLQAPPAAKSHQPTQTYAGNTLVTFDPGVAAWRRGTDLAAHEDPKSAA
jgi:hypothetical protein